MEVLQLFPLPYAQCRFLFTNVTRLPFSLRTNMVHTPAIIKLQRLNCDHTIVTKRLNRWDEPKDLVNRLRSGAPRTTIERDQTMVDMALKEMDTIIKSIKEEFKTLEIDISRSILQWRLKNSRSQIYEAFIETSAQ